MSYMFARTKFNRNISEWNVSNVRNMEGMFYSSGFKNFIASWDVSNVENMN